MITTDKPTPATLPSCVFCGRPMTTPDTVAGAPIHPDCFTRMCVAALVDDVPAWRWIPFQGWVFETDATHRDGQGVTTAIQHESGTRQEAAMDKKSSKTADAGRPICPECGKGDSVRIAYGYPSGEMIEASGRGEVTLGGCIVGPDSPTRRCRACGHAWGGPPSRIDGIAAFFPGGAG